MATKRQDSSGPAVRKEHGGHPNQLVERMFSGFGHPIPVPTQSPRPPTQPFVPLHQSKAPAGATYRLQAPAAAGRVQADSPASEVMTDLRRVGAIAIRGLATLNDAHRSMVAHAVRSLFVVDAERTVLGIVTSTDLLGERPIQVAQQRGVRHDEVLVREVMTPADTLEAMDLEDVLRARVGDVIASLRLSGRQHALVIESTSAEAATRIVRGIFSLTQIARQLGLPPQSGHDVARTFAEIEAAIGA